MKPAMLSLAIAIIISTIGCKKENNNNTQQDRLRLKQKITKRISNTDTLRYTYTGENVEVKTTYTGSTAVYTNTFTKNGSRYDALFNNGTANTHSGSYFMNAQGLIDSTVVIYISTGAINNRNKLYYNSDGRAIRSISNYNTYENDIKQFYNPANDFAYWIYDRPHFTNPALTLKDSVVFEYYLDKPNKTGINYELEDKYGKLETHLVKKRSYFDVLNANALRQTYEYEYETDANGYVTKRIWNIFSKPSNTLTYTDTSYYQYEIY